MSLITLSIQLDHQLARCLSSASAANFIAQRPDRFSIMALDGVEDPGARRHRTSAGRGLRGRCHMTWLGTLAEALLLRAFEQASGCRTAVLSDERGVVPLTGPGGGYEDGYVVLSSRKFDSCPYR